MGAVRQFRAERWIVALFATLGALLVGLAVVFAVVAEDKIWAFFCVVLPCAALGLWLLGRVPPLLRTLILIDDAGIDLNVPVWAGGRLQPGQSARLEWGEILRLTHERRVYYPLLFPFAVDEYRLHTTRGDYTLTKNICPEPERVLDAVAARTGLSVVEIGL